MRLSGMKKLMGVLAIGMQLSVVKSMLGASSFSCEEKENVVSAIGFLMLLKRRKGTDKAFLEELKHLLSVCSEEELLTKITHYEQESPDLLTENAKQFESVGCDFEPTQIQSQQFKKALYKIGKSVGKRELEILVALTPIPEAGKENIEVGHELFHQMERHGCISENDTELLQEMLELLELRAALQVLLKYRQEFSTNSSKGDGDLVTQESGPLSHPVQEMNQYSSSESENGNKSSGLWHTHLQAVLDPSNGLCSRDLNDCGLQDSEVKLTIKLLPRRKRPHADDKEQYPAEEGNSGSGSCDLVASPPPPKTLCLASISDGDSSLNGSSWLPESSNDRADTHRKTQSLPVAFTSTASVCTEGVFFHSTDPPDCATSLGCHQHQR